MSADLSKLKSILAKSKAVMRQTDESLGNPMGGVNNTPSTQRGVAEHEEKEIPNLTEEFANKYGMTDGKIQNKSVSPKGGQYPNISKSKMPKAILDAMINDPIEIPENPFASNSFSLEDVPELMEQPKPKRVVESKQTKQPAPKSKINRETIKQIVREEFEDLVRDVLDEYMEKSLVTEDIHIKIGNTMFGGSLKPLPKSNKRVIKR
jgi:hypothetical protein|tara:strand:+ start:2324 stop:2944 length:621 start_codon:yes stop_codon:yes gene_type:complete